MKATYWILRGAGLAIVLNLGLALPAVAQDPVATSPDGRPLKIAVINGDRVIAESNIGAQVQQEAQAEATGWQTRIRDKQAEIDAKVAQAQEQRLTLTDEALARIQSEIDQLNVDLQRLQDDAQRVMNRIAGEAQERINAVLIPAVEQLATAEGYDLILDTRLEGILYFANVIDVTDEFIAMVNAQTPAPQEAGQDSRREKEEERQRPPR